MIDNNNTNLILSNMKTFRIYQINEERENANMFMFASLDRLTRWGLRNSLSIDLYNKVYEGEYEERNDNVYVMLEDIFRMFNRRVEGFKGHSLSVSDVVEVEGKYYYCDDFGFEEVKF